jgi:hypothetical protein
MTRRKREIVGLTNERDFPHLVELTFPPGGFRSVFLEIDAFHRERRIPVRRGRNRHEVEQFHIRFCFPDAAIADAFRNRFGGERLTNASSIHHRRSPERIAPLSSRDLLPPSPPAEKTAVCHDEARQARLRRRGRELVRGDRQW